MLRIRVDFNNMKKDGNHVYINTWAQKELAEVLEPGLPVTLYKEHDIQVEAVLKVQINDDGTVQWCALADWSTLQDLS